MLRVIYDCCTVCVHIYITNSQLSCSPKVAQAEVELHKFSKSLGRCHLKILGAKAVI